MTEEHALRLVEALEEIARTNQQWLVLMRSLVNHSQEKPAINIHHSNSSN